MSVNFLTKHEGRVKKNKKKKFGVLTEKWRESKLLNPIPLNIKKQPKAPAGNFIGTYLHFTMYKFDT